jgi:hypothetical protein
MHSRRPTLVLTLSTILIFLLVGCGSTTQTPPTPVEATASLATPTAETIPTDIVDGGVPTPEVIPTDIVDGGGEEGIPDTTEYLDDRSSAESVVRSLFNAINSRHYVRAYSYWEPNAEGLPPFEEFEQSFAQTDYVNLFDVGEVLTDAGAGQQYFAVPYIISVTNTDGTVEAFAGCYLLHLANPAIQATPPFQPLAIRDAAIRQMGEGDDSFTISATLCEEILAS